MLFIYIVLLIWQIVWLVQALRSNKGWKALLVLEVGSVILALGLMWYYDTLPGYGMMPGWAYFAEVFRSLVFGCVYCAMTLTSAVCAFFKRKK